MAPPCSSPEASQAKASAPRRPEQNARGAAWDEGEPEAAAPRHLPDQVSAELRTSRRASG